MNMNDNKYMFYGLKGIGELGIRILIMMDDDVMWIIIDWSWDRC